MQITITKQALKTFSLLSASIGMFVISAHLLSVHANAVLAVQDVSLPLVAELPKLERRLALLTQQVEMADLHRSVQFGSQEERVRTYVLTAKPDYDRLFAFFDIASDHLAHRGLLTDFSDVAMGDSVPLREGIVVRPVTLHFSVHEDGLRAWTAFMDLAGLLTVGDALSDEEKSLLLAQTEEENPAGIVALEQYFSVDLLRYARDSKSYENQLLRSFTSEGFGTLLRTTVQSSLLRDAHKLLGGDFGEVLEESGLWPLPLLTVESVKLSSGASSGWSRVEMMVLLHTREN